MSTNKSSNRLSESIESQLFENGPENTPFITVWASNFPVTLKTGDGGDPTHYERVKLDSYHHAEPYSLSLICQSDIIIIMQNI